MNQTGRLTARTHSGSPDISFSQFPNPRDLMVGYAKLYVRLCEYEDTGLTPEGFERLKAEKATRENPQPLTLEQLRERKRDGKPIYATSDTFRLANMKGVWCILDQRPRFGGGVALAAIYGHNMTLAGDDYSINWLAYDYPPTVTP